LLFKYKNAVVDCTGINFSETNFINDLLCEIEINTQQAAHKVQYHRNFLEKWLAENKDVKLSSGELWMIREQCISDLSQKADQSFFM
jgi:hypothetical protein